MVKTKTFFFNGQQYYTNQKLNILDLLNYFNYDFSLITVEYNTFICSKKKWKNISIIHNAKLEIVTIVGGC